MNSQGRETRSSGTTGGAIALAIAASLACTPLAAHADGGAPAPASHRWLALAVLGGSTVFDAHLADYQWDVNPRAAWGASVTAGDGRFGLGTRVWTTTTVQHTGVTTVEGDPTVRSTTWDAVGEGRVTSVFGADVVARASVGWLALRYDPDRLTIDTGGVPVVVDMKPVNEVIGGGALAVRHTLPGAWSTGVEVERRVFALDTAHRNGSVIEERRETFGEWSVRLEVARVYGRR